MSLDQWRSALRCALGRTKLDDTTLRFPGGGGAAEEEAEKEEEEEEEEREMAQTLRVFPGAGRAFGGT